jgi:hypothetical protein
VEFQESADVVFSVTSRAVARLGYILQNLDRASGLLTFVAPQQRVTGSAFIEQMTEQTSRLTVSGSANPGNLITSALVGRAAFGVNLIASADAPARVAREVVDTVCMTLGEGDEISSPDGNVALRVIFGVLGFFLFLFILIAALL